MRVLPTSGIVETGSIPAVLIIILALLALFFAFFFHKKHQSFAGRSGQLLLCPRVRRSVPAAVLPAVFLFTVFPALAQEGEPISTPGQLENLFKSEGGSGYLTANIDFDKTMDVRRDVTLDLAGHAITGKFDPVIQVSGTLKLKDSKGGGFIGKANNAVQDGIIGVYVYQGGSFIMSGGNLGEKTGQKLLEGVRVKTGGSFTMSGGTISNNSTGVFLESGAAFTLSGSSEISGGKGVRVGSGCIVNLSGSPSISGRDQAISVDAGVASFALSGSPSISGSSDWLGDISLQSGAKITVTGKMNNTTPIRIRLDPPRRIYRQH